MVSIIIPYNKDRGYLAEAVASARLQTYQNIEIILEQSDNSGGYNINRGIEKAKGKYICYLCEDDVLPLDSIMSRVNLMDQTGYDFIHGRGIEFWETGKEKPWFLTNPYAQLSSMLERNGIMGGTTMYKASLFKEFKWDEKLWTGGEYDFHLNLLYHGKRLGFLDKVVYHYRRHELQKSLGNTSQEYQAKRHEQIELIKLRYK